MDLSAQLLWQIILLHATKLKPQKVMKSHRTIKFLAMAPVVSQLAFAGGSSLYFPSSRNSIPSLMRGTKQSILLLHETASPARSNFKFIAFSLPYGLP